jgi:dGTPase
MYGSREAQRWVAEPAKATEGGRSPYQRDRARVLHSAALRRLAAKTQVVGVGEDDFPRTRLTHSLECAQVGRELAATLGADPDIVDAACLAHDLGHPPFGHNGEQALALAAESVGGFEGNAQSLRILTRLEAKVLTADGGSAGLNLTRAVLDAATKYPWTRRAGTTKFGAYADDEAVFRWFREDAPADDARCVEAQVMDWADDVAYSVHDLEDGVHSGQVPLGRIDTDAVVHLAALTGCATTATLESLYVELSRQPWWVHHYDATMKDQAAVKRMTSELTGRLTAAVVRATREAYGDGPLQRYAANVVVPETTRAECELLKAVAVHYVMIGRRAVQERQRVLLTELVELLLDHAPGALEPAMREVWLHAATDDERLRVVIDQVASLTDPSAVAWHQRLGARGVSSGR